MGQPGLGFMIGQLFGHDSRGDLFKAAVGHTIKSVTMDKTGNGGDGALMFDMDGCEGFTIVDDARSCCESRYMTTDDDLDHYKDSLLIGIEVKDGPTIEEDGEPHEQLFLIVKTNKGEFTVVTHNAHNGYYGGISPVIRARAGSGG